MKNNPELTFKELKQMIATTKDVKKLPTAKALLTGGSACVASKIMLDGSRLSAFKNGFALFQMSRFYTVIRVDQCGDYTYHSHTGPLCFSADYFEDKPWMLRLQLEAEENIVQNQGKVERKRYAAIKESINYEWVEDKLETDIDTAMIELYETERLLEGLTKKQRFVVEMRVLQSYTLSEIGTLLNISKQGAGKIYAQAIKKMSKNLKRNQK